MASDSGYSGTFDPGVPGGSGTGNPGTRNSDAGGPAADIPITGDSTVISEAPGVERLIRPMFLDGISPRAGAFMAHSIAQILADGLDALQIADLGYFLINIGSTLGYMAGQIALNDLVIASRAAGQAVPPAAGLRGQAVDTARVDAGVQAVRADAMQAIKPFEELKGGSAGQREPDTDSRPE